MAAVDWNKIGAILGSKAFENAAGIAGAGISAYASGKQSDAQRAQQAAQFEAQLALSQQDRADRMGLARASAAADASPLGDYEQFALRQALLREIMPGLRNFSATPGDPAVAAAMPKLSGGFRIPEGGFSAEALASLSPRATTNAIGRRQQHVANLDPNAPGVNFEAMGFDPEVAAEAQGATNAYQAGRQQALLDQESETKQQLAAALQRNYAASQQKSGGGGFWKKLGKVAAFAAPFVAAPFTGGTSLALIGAGSGAASGLLNGGGVKGALTGAAMGAATSGGLGKALPKVKYDPVTYSRINTRFPG